MNSKYLGVGLGIVVLSVVAIVAIVGFGGSSDKKATVKKAAVVKLLDYEKKNASLSITTHGKLVGEEKRRAIRITITPDDRGIEILNGYDQTVERSLHYPNTQAAYESFIRAVNYAGFTSKRPSKIIDERGICAGGRIYQYDLYDENSNQISHSWGASCSVEMGTMAGSGPYIRRLFQNQITDYNKFIKGVRL